MQFEALSGFNATSIAEEAFSDVNAALPVSVSAVVVVNITSGMCGDGMCSPSEMGTACSDCHQQGECSFGDRNPRALKRFSAIPRAPLLNPGQPVIAPIGSVRISCGP